MKKINLFKEILKSNTGLNRLPYKLIYAVTYNCNMKCRICNIWKKQYKKEMPIEKIRSFFKKTNHFSWIDLTGGEPTLRKDINDVVSVIFENCKKLCLFHIPTNGYFPKKTRDLAEKTLEFKPTRFAVTISLDGPRKLHDSLRGKKGSWKKAISTYRLLKSINNKRLIVKFGFTASQYNAGLLKQTIEEAKKEIPTLSPRDFHLNIVHYSKHYYGTTQPKKKPDTEKILRDVNFLKNEINKREPLQYIQYRYLSLAEYYLKNKLTPLPCTALSSSCFMDPQGNIYPCTIYNKKIGNIEDYGFSLKKLWSSKKAVSARKKIRKVECPQCWSPCQAYTSLIDNPKEITINFLRALAGNL